MNFKRNHAAEATMLQMGLRQMESYACQTGRVNYVITHDVMHDHWTASYKLHPYKAPTATKISVGSKEVYAASGTFPGYETRAAAERACYITHRELRKKLS